MDHCGGFLKNGLKVLCCYAGKLCSDSGKKEFIDCLVSLHSGAPANGNNNHLLVPGENLFSMFIGSIEQLLGPLFAQQCGR